MAPLSVISGEQDAAQTLVRLRVDVFRKADSAIAADADFPCFTPASARHSASSTSLLRPTLPFTSMQRPPSNSMTVADSRRGQESHGGCQKWRLEKDLRAVGDAVRCRAPLVRYAGAAFICCCASNEAWRIGREALAWAGEDSCDFMGFSGSVEFPGWPEWHATTGLFVRNPSEKRSFCPGVADGFESRRNFSPASGNPVLGLVAQALVHHSHLCQIGRSDQDPIARPMKDRCLLDWNRKSGHWFAMATVHFMRWL